MSPPRQRKRGYTLIEVMMAIAVLTAGAMGIMALHQAATRGTLEAREMTTASQLAQRWVERLRRDGLRWTRSSQTANAALLANTAYLRAIPAAGASTGWIVPPTAAGATEFTSFDFYGRDTTAADQMHYCTNMRLEWLYPGRAMRADVRVWWRRRSSGTGTTGTPLTGCAAGLDPNALTGDLRARMVYASTVLRFTPVSR